MDDETRSARRKRRRRHMQRALKRKGACGVRALRPGLPPPALGPPVSERLTGSLWPLPRLIVISARCDDAEEEEEPDGWLIFIAEGC